MRTHVLVVAKAPVPGWVKTRLGAEIGMEQAAQVAAASLLDTLAACTEGYGADCCHLALAGNLTSAARGRSITRALARWSVFPQRGDGLADRLVHAHNDVAKRATGPVVQIGMDTPQVTPVLLGDAVAALGDSGERDDPHGYDAVLGPAVDGGWWVLALRDPRTATPLRGVVMSTATTHDDTRRALAASGLRVTTTAVLRDVDTAADARAAVEAAPDGLFARAWMSLRDPSGEPLGGAGWR